MMLLNISDLLEDYTRKKTKWNYPTVYRFNLIKCDFRNDGVEDKKVYVISFKRG